MLCGFSIPYFRRKVKRVRPVISAPIVQSTDRMDAWRNHVDNKSDSGVFYLVPNPNGTGKHVIRRPRPPPTSPPLDDDFNAITQTHRGTTSRYPDQDFQNRLVATSPISPAPFRRDFDNKPHHAVSRSATINKPIIRAPIPRAHAHDVMSQQTSGVGPSGSINRKGKGKDEVYGQYAEYESYMQEMEKMFGKSGDLEVSMKRIGDEAGSRESVNIGRVKSTRSRSKPGTKAPIKGTGSSGIARNASLSSTEYKAPKPRQDYEIVSRRVIENTPDKTVTISTWREQVAQEVNPEKERMSIYYVGVDMQSDDLEVQRDPEEMESSVGTPIPNGNGLFVNGGNTESGATTPMPDPDHSSFEGNGAYRYSAGKGRPNGRGRGSARRKGVPKATSQRSFTPEPRSHHASSSSSSNTMASSKSTEDPPTPPPKPPKLFIKTGLHQSTPIESRMPIPPFRPTRSGSTISSIRSSSTSSASFALQKVLQSCKPSLTHVAPILARLGITETDHLKAVANLSPETRDREVKEEALRQGITVVEWAILVDHLRVL